MSEVIEMTLDEMRDALWEMCKEVYQGSRGALDDGMVLPKSLIVDALKRLNYEMAQKRVAEYTLKQIQDVMFAHEHRRFEWEKE